MMSLQGSLSIERMCKLAGVSRATFYRSLREQQPVKEEMEVRSAIQEIALEHRRRYGYRRITAELRRRGMTVNHKRVLRMMRNDNLLAVQPRAFVVTADSDHGFEVYMNLAGRMKLTDIDQLWVADLTYIRLKAEFVYLAVILDGHSRKVVGWALERTLASRLAVAALEQAIAERQPLPGLVHHSDRGVQYACAEYVAVLKKHGMIPSMSRPANPYDNASCESFIKTLKREEIYARRYDNLEHLRANLEEFIEVYYNRQRLHSALGYQSPEEFEKQSESRSVTADFQSATMNFFENDGNEKRVSELMVGEGDSIAVPFPKPHPLLEDPGRAQ
jgi:transposase InsO family protein